jgi:NDP-sugar pyrophosphorylase family protein
LKGVFEKEVTVRDWKEEVTVKKLFPPHGNSVAESYLANFRYPWEALDGLADFIRGYGKTLSCELYEEREKDVWIAKNARIAQNVSIQGPAIVGEESELRVGAFLRGAVIVGKNAVVGNSVELKNCILFDRAQVPHFNYVGDSILGYRAHLGAGAITSNVKSDKTMVSVLFEGERLETGRRKLGAILGEGVEVGCQSVLNPGTVIGEGSRIYPLCSVRGYVPPRTLCKTDKDRFMLEET